MARPAKPWFRASRNAWYVEINGQQHNLGSDEKEAIRRFHQLMAAPEETKAAPVVAGPTVAEVFEKFLDWCSRHRSPATYEWSRYRIQFYINAVGPIVRLPVTSFKPFHVVEWLDKQTTWSRTYRHGMISALQRPFNWAVRLGYIDKNPIQYVEKPGVERREQYVSADQWPMIRDHYKDGDPFRDFLEFCWETGCRPQEARKIEARHVQLDANRIFFPKQEAKGKRKPRHVYMTPRAEEIISKLALRSPSGYLFLNANGQPWTAYALNCRFVRLQMATGRAQMKKLGIEPSKAADLKQRARENRKLQAKHGIKFACYSLRHGFASRKLEQGMPPATVAALLGHNDLSMISRFYSHLDQADDHLRGQLNSGDV